MFNRRSERLFQRSRHRDAYYELNLDGAEEGRVDDLLLSLASTVVNDYSSARSSEGTGNQSSVYSGYHSLERNHRAPASEESRASRRSAAAAQSMTPQTQHNRVIFSTGGNLEPSVNPESESDVIKDDIEDMEDNTDDNSEDDVQYRAVASSSQGDTQESHGIEEAAAQTANNGEDFMVIGPTENILRLDPSLGVEAVSGHINNQPTLITAQIYHALSETVISRAMVLQLGLTPNEDDSDNEIQHVDFGRNHVEPVVGLVRVSWRKALALHLPPLRVFCLVCEHSPYPLVFGQNFLRRREHYWDEWSSPSRTLS